MQGLQSNTGTACGCGGTMMPQFAGVPRVSRRRRARPPVAGQPRRAHV